MMQKPREESDDDEFSNRTFDYRSAEDRARLLSGPKFDEVLLIEPRKDMLAEIVLLRQAIFRDVMDNIGLTKAQTAAMLGVSPATVLSWLRTPTQKASRNVPTWALELLVYKTGTRRYDPGKERLLAAGHSFAPASPPRFERPYKRKKTVEELAWKELKRRRTRQNRIELERLARQTEGKT